jgi:Zn-dependent peptidase ImmA (M78 family)
MIKVKIDRKNETTINKDVFVALFNIPHIKDYKEYNNAIDTNLITFKNLKDLAVKAGVPYPLLFALKDVVSYQIDNKNKNIYDKISTKEEIRLSSRGKMEINDIELIIKDIGRKQEFLKNRLFANHLDNTFIGCIAKKLKQNGSVITLAEHISQQLGIDLLYLRSINKERVLEYLTNCFEAKGIFVSFSSYNYMPQNISPVIELSGVCIKDKKFPFIFINTRDGDDKPKILESSGRQIFTLLTMISCVAMNQFVLSSKAGKLKEDPIKIAYAIAAELIIPQRDLTETHIENLEQLKEKAHYFRITPSMLLYRLEKNKNISKDLTAQLRKLLIKEVKEAAPTKRRAPSPATGYTKYNGRRFSKEVIKAFNSNKITQLELNNILFRSGKFNNKLFDAYLKKHR